MSIALRKYNMYVFAFIVLLFIVIITTFVFGNTNTKETQLTYYKTIQINSGDTLWDIAKSHYNGNNDLRNYILEIQHFNHMDSDVLITGQTIVLPIHH